MPATAKSKTVTRQQALDEARVLHETIAKKMAAAGITHKTIKRDVCRACSNVRRSDRSGCN